MLKNLVVCEVLCIAATISGCDSGVPEDPVARSVGERSAAPVSPATGINPCTGWAGGLFGAVATYTQDIGTVSFHGGTWTVPIAAAPGQSISEVAFTIEAPTGSAGDPTSVRVGLYSNGTALAFANLTPFGLGARVTGNIPLSPPRVVGSGEVLELEFAPLAPGGYATSDTKIDAVMIARPPRMRFVSSLDSIVFSGAPSANGPDGMRMNSTNDQILMTIRLSDDETLVGVTGKVKVGAGGKLRMDVTAYNPEAFSGAGQSTLLAEYDTTTTNGLVENMTTTMLFRPSSAGPRLVSVLFRALSIGSAAAFVNGLEISTN